MKPSVDIQLALTYHFKDPKWMGKLLLGGVMAMVPILNFAIIGYELQIVHALRRNDYTELPKWDDVGKFLTDGLKLGIARLILALPAILLIFGGMALYFGGVLIAALATSGSSQADENIMLTIFFGMAFMLVIIFAVAWLYGMMIGLVMPAVQANYVRYGTFASCFNFKAAFDFVRRNLSGYIMVCLTGFVAGFIWFAVYMVASMIPCLNYILIFVVGLPGMVWMMTAQSHALGQLLAIDALDSATAVTTS